MRDKLCIVTGSNTGIGKATAKALARAGAHVVMVVRNERKGEAARHEIRTVTGNDQIDLLLADFSRLADVRRVAGEILERYPRIDVLINNIGGTFGKRQITDDGFEMTMEVNYLAPFLFTNLLLDRIQASAPARIINVSSAAHTAGQIRWEDFDGGWQRSGFRAYGDAKLAVILFTRELAKRLAGTGVTVNSLHPGVVGTEFASESGDLVGFFFGLARPLLKTPEQGAATSIYLATAPEGGQTSGAYFANSKSKQPSKRAKDDAAAQRLWEISARLTGLSAGVAV